MCGVAGIFNYRNGSPVYKDHLEGMISVINHRGPDEKGIYISDNLGIGNVRLDIIDLFTGKQPMQDSENKFCIVFNGEIFNYIELRKDLESEGLIFKTKSDTEVILNSYKFWGTDCLNKFNGQFAFAIWDKTKKELFLARDRVGICPLYYTDTKGSFLFGSEIKAILQAPGVSPELSVKSLCQLFTYWNVLSPGTMFKELFEVRPGYYLKVNSKGIHSAPYWKLNFPDSSGIKKIKLSDAISEFEEILTDSVRIRLRADVPVAAYLSGGLDSTSITSLIKKVEPKVLNTFSTGFTDSAFDETAFQSEASKYLNTNHFSISCSYSDIARVFPDVVWHAESPLLRTAPAPMFNLSRLVRQNNIKVVITGEGADEMLAGYDIFKEMIIRRFWSRFPDSNLRPLLLKKLYSYIPQIKNSTAQALKFFYGFRLEDTENPVYSHILRWNNGNHILKYLNKNFSEVIADFNPVESWMQQMPDGFTKWGDLAKAQYIESTMFMSGYLLSSQGDRMLMANSVEGRYPFLDHRLIEFAARLPENFKMNGIDEKYILKKTMKGRIPESILTRPKQAYRAPASNSLIGAYSTDFIREVIYKNNIRKTGIFNDEMIETLLKKINSSGTASELENMIITAVVSTQIFFQLFIEKRNNIGLNPMKTVQMSKE